MKPTSKTPYEIRLELLQLAFDILVKKHEAQDSAKAYPTTGSDKPLWCPTTAPTTEDVVAEAEKMNAFISKGNNQS